MKTYRTRTNAKTGTLYVICPNDAVAVGIINGNLDLAHYNRDDGQDHIGASGGMYCPAAVALAMIDRANLNTTANALRVELLAALKTIEELRKP